MKQGLPGVPTWQEYLVTVNMMNFGIYHVSLCSFDIYFFCIQRIPAGSRIGLDATLTTASDAHDLQARLDTVNSKLVPVARNLVDIAWGNERPLPPQDKIFVHPVEYTGNIYIYIYDDF